MNSAFEVDRECIRSFMLGGNCNCTLTSPKSQYTYKIKRSDNSYSIYFVNVCTAYEEYVYAGYMAFNRDGSVVWRRGAKGRFDETAPSIQALLYVVRNAKTNTLHPQVKVWHHNKCGRCGRALTDAESIQRGLGPECVKMVKNPKAYAPTKSPNGIKSAEKQNKKEVKKQVQGQVTLFN